MKKIVFMANTTWYIYNFKMGLIKRLAEKGYEIIIIAPKADFDIPYEFHHISINGKGRNPLQDARLFLQMVKLFRKISPDLIINYTIKPNIYGSLAARLLKIPTIINIAGLGIAFKKKNISSNFVKFLYKISSESANFIFFQNSDDQKIITSNCKNKNFDILPGSGVDLKKFSPENRDKNEVFTFLFLGRLLKEKGIYELVEATKIIKEKHKIETQLLGFTDVENPTSITSEEVERWHDKGFIRYMGFTNNVSEYILACDCVVLPSYYGEGVPKSLLEAASMEKPIITTDHVGCKEAVDDGVSGFLCKVANVDDLVDKMLKILKMDGDELSVMGKSGREKMIKEFNEEIVISKNFRVIEKLIGVK